MSDRTLAVLDAVAILTAQRGYPPSNREVAAMMRLPVMTVHDHLSALREEGLLHWADGGKRTAVLTPAGRDHLSRVVWFGGRDARYQ